MAQLSVARRIPGLDGLRAVAILVVFLSHYMVYVVPNHAHLMEVIFPGMLGVSLFFVISGFLISNLLTEEFKSKGFINLNNFYTRRFLRLSPPLFVYVACVFVAYSLFDSSIEYKDFISALTYSSNYYQMYAHTAMYYMPVWSLAIEEHFYILLPISMIFCLRTSFEKLTRFVAAGIVVSLVWRMIYVLAFNPTEDFVYWRTDTRLDSMLFGVVLTCLINLPNGERWRDRLSSGKAAFIGMGLMAFSVFYRGEFFRMTGRYTVQGVALMLLMAFLVYNRHAIAAGVRKALNVRPMLFISKISYSLYLWHLTIIKFCDHVFHHVSPVGAGACAIVSVLMAVASFHLLEKPFMALRAKFGSHASEEVAAQTSAIGRPAVLSPVAGVVIPTA